MLNRDIRMDITMMEATGDNWIDDPEANAEYERIKDPCDYQPEGTVVRSFQKQLITLNGVFQGTKLGI